MRTRNQQSMSFLDKFLGKTSRLGKAGISGIITQAREIIKQEPEKNNYRSCFISINSEGNNKKLKINSLRHKYSISQINKQRLTNSQLKLTSQKQNKQRQYGSLSSRFQFTNNPSKLIETTKQSSRQTKSLSKTQCMNKINLNKIGQNNKKSNSKYLLYDQLLDVETMKQFDLLNLMRNKFNQKRSFL